MSTKKEKHTIKKHGAQSIHQSRPASLLCPRHSHLLLENPNFYLLGKSCIRCTFHFQKSPMHIWLRRREVLKTIKKCLYFKNTNQFKNLVFLNGRRCGLLVHTWYLAIQYLVIGLFVFKKNWALLIQSTFYQINLTSFPEMSKVMLFLFHAVSLAYTDDDMDGWWTVKYCVWDGQGDG